VPESIIIASFLYRSLAFSGREEIRDRFVLGTATQPSEKLISATTRS